MTLAETLQFQAIAAAGVALLVGLSFLLFGLRARARIGDLGALAPDLTLVETAIDAQGRAGVGLSEDGRLLLARGMGADVAVRVAGQAGVQRVTIRGDEVILALDDVGFPELRLTLSPPPLWLGRLAK